MDNTVFFAWQSDLSRKFTRDIIHNAAVQALAHMALHATLEESPRLDHDTLDVPGAPEIAATIFEKIANCSFFLADLSFVGETTSQDPNKPRKKLSNPNVLTELGYAAAKIGWSRIILVMNTKYGAPHELNFDLIHRRFPVQFKIGPENKDSAEEIQAGFSEEIERALLWAARTEHQAINNAIGSLDINCLKLMEAYGPLAWFNSPSQATMGEIVSFQWFFTAITRLLDLRLLRTDVSPVGRAYAYHWTLLGKRVNEKLGFSNPPEETVTINT